MAIEDEIRSILKALPEDASSTPMGQALMQVAASICAYYRALVDNGIPEDLAGYLTEAMQDRMTEKRD